MTSTYTVTVKATDRGGKSAEVDVLITVTAANDPPVAAPDDATTFEDTKVVIDVLANDSDPEDEQSDLRLTVFNSGPNAPLNGTVSVNEPANVGDNRTITYKPNANYNGPDTFTYQVGDSGSPPPGGPSLSSTASVTVQIDRVNDAPTYALDAVTFEVSEDSEPERRSRLRADGHGCRRRHAHVLADRIGGLPDQSGHWPDRHGELPRRDRRADLHRHGDCH